MLGKSHIVTKASKVSMHKHYMYPRVCVNMREESSGWYDKYDVVLLVGSILVIGEHLKAFGSI